MSNPSGERLDHYLVRTGHAASRRDAREMVARGAVWLNGRRGIKGALVHSGDNVEVEAPLAVAAIEPHFYANLCRALGCEQWLAHQTDDAVQDNVIAAGYKP